MRIKFSISISLERSPKDEEEQHEHRDNDGSLVETAPQPLPAGFNPPGVIA